MSNLNTQILSPGQNVSIPIPPGSVAIKVSNTSPYDMDFYGYGVVGDDWMPAGTEYMLFHDVSDTGQLNIVLVNNRNISPANPGVILLVAYYSLSVMPKGNWPVSIPQSIVNTVNNVSSTLVNTTNPSGTNNIIQIKPTGDTNVVTSLDNIGDFVNGDVANPGTETFANMNKVRFADAAGNVWTVMTYDVNNNFIIGNSKTGGSSTYITGDNTFLQNSINSASFAKFNSSGISLLSGAYNFIVGTMTRIGGSVSTCGTGTVISHGLGVNPTMISGTPVGSQPFSATVGIGNSTTSTFTATIGSGTQIDWTAINQ